MKRFIYLLLVSVSYLLLSSYSSKPKPHLIVGNWELMDSQKTKTVFFKDGKPFLIERIAFSSDEITSNFILSRKDKKEEENLTFGFKVFEPFDDFKNPILLLKNLCDNKSRMVFSILRLDKGFLELRFEKESSSENMMLKDDILIFERTAGPPENMPDYKSKMENKN